PVLHAGAEPVPAPELRNDVDDLGGRCEQPAVEGHQDENVGEGLGRREDPEDVVDPGGTGRRTVGEPDRLVEADLAVAGAEDDTAVVEAGPDVGLDRGGNSLQCVLVQASHGPDCGAARAAVASVRPPVVPAAAWRGRHPS